MRLYSNLAKTFIEDCERNQIREKLRESFFQAWGFSPSDSEVASWQNSLRALAMIMSRAGLVNQGVILEFRLPNTSARADCVLTGYDNNGAPAVLVIELKQWEKCELAANGENEVTTFVGKGQRDVPHPSVQVSGYANYLRDNHEACHTDAKPITVSSCAYLHNYFPKSNDPLLNPRFAKAIEESPPFTADDVDNFVAYIRTHVGHGDGLEVLQRIEENRYRPSKKLMDHVAAIVQNKPEYTLLDEQLVAFDAVVSAARGNIHSRQKTAVIIRGGPGSGKSVLAINLVAQLLRESYATHYVTGSKAFTETLRKIIGARGRELFTYSNDYMTAMPDSVDVLVVDEAHRIRDVSTNQWTPKDKRSGLKQIQELFNASRVTVFLIDDNQTVRPNEIGSTAYIHEYAAEEGIKVLEYTLEDQFRCGGSDAFVNWVNAALGIGSETAYQLNDETGFEFRIFDSPSELEEVIFQKTVGGATARMTAGFCWPWSHPNTDGSLVNDVVVGAYSRPWNAKPDATKLAKGIPKANHWAYAKEGIHQVGCVYTAQGFEFDYVGVIFGNDLLFDPAKGGWITDKSQSYDTVVKRSKESFEQLLKNTYRVLLTRGLKGCYVHFTNTETRNYFRSLVAQPG